jgi:hypothetical protein
LRDGEKRFLGAARRLVVADERAEIQVSIAFAHESAARRAEVVRHVNIHQTTKSNVIFAGIGRRGLEKFA